MKDGNFIDDVIVIDAPDSIIGIDVEQNCIDDLCEFLNTSFNSFEQKLIFEDGKTYDRIDVLKENGEKNTIFLGLYYYVCDELSI